MREDRKFGNTAPAIYGSVQPIKSKRRPSMVASYKRIGYAYTPKLGEKPVFSADVEIDGISRQFEVRANNVFETWQAICRHLGIPFVMQH
jgi:hypothetical protein